MVLAGDPRTRRPNCKGSQELQIRVKVEYYK